MGKAAHGTFEIWFYVVIDPENERAIWIRHTRRVPHGDAQGEGEAISWAATFTRDDVPLALKSVRPVGDLTAQATPVRVTLGDATFEADRAKGRVTAGGRAIRWDFRFPVASTNVKRQPSVITALPLPVHAEHVHARTKVAGWYEIDGERSTLGPRARMVQAHIWGSKQAAEIFWIWAPALLGIEEGGAELVAARPRVARWMRRVASLVLDADALHIDGTSLTRTLRTRVTLIRPGVLEVRAKTRSASIVLRAHAPLHTFVGYVYRGPDGSEVHVAQSDVARCEIEIYKRRAMGMTLDATLTAPVAAIEIHQPDPLAGITYLPWEDEGPIASPRVASTASRSSDARLVPLPAISQVLATGLTYRDHVRETGSNVPTAPVVFRKDARTVLRDGGRARIPTRDEMVAALSAIEPGIDVKLERRLRAFPALMDYEVELGVLVLEPIAARDLERPDFTPRLAWFLANDLTARACQILGEGMEDPYAYWAVAKSFPGFLPVSANAWVTEESLDHAPVIDLSTRVNGDLRQNASTNDLAYSPREMLRAVATFLRGDIPAGLALITGTPAGVGLAVPRWKKAIADVALDRFGKLRAAIASHARGGKLLRAGDEVSCTGTRVGSCRVEIV